MTAVEICLNQGAQIGNLHSSCKSARLKFIGFGTPTIGERISLNQMQHTFAELTRQIMSKLLLTALNLKRSVLTICIQKCFTDSADGLPFNY